MTWSPLSASRWTRLKDVLSRDKPENSRLEMAVKAFSDHSEAVEVDEKKITPIQAKTAIRQNLKNETSYSHSVACRLWMRL